MTAAKALPTGARYRLPLKSIAGRIVAWSRPVTVARVRLDKANPADRIVEFDGGHVSLPMDAPCARVDDEDGA